MWLLYIGALILLLQVIALLRGLKNGEDPIGEARRNLERVGRQLKVRSPSHTKKLSEEALESKER